jgi:hypothetical protein
MSIEYSIQNLRQTILQNLHPMFPSHFQNQQQDFGCQGDLKPGKERDQGVTGTDLLHLTPFEAPSQSPRSQPTTHIRNSISSP